MGSGFKDFTAGDVLTADQVDGYLMRQSMMTFATETARDTALSGVLDEGMFCYTEDTDSVFYYDGSAWIPFHSSWQSYTPTWNGLTVGNGVSLGMYRYQFGDLRMIVELTWGSTTSATGDYTVDIADGQSAQSTVSVNSLGGCYSYNNTGDRYAGMAIAQSGAGVVDLYANQDAGNVNELSSTVPFTWGSADIVRVDIVVPL